MLIEKVKHHQSKLVMYRDSRSSAKQEKLEDSTMACGGNFDSVDDSYNHWNTLFSKISVEHLPMKRMRGQFLFETQKMMPHEKENLQETVL